MINSFYQKLKRHKFLVAISILSLLSLAYIYSSVSRPSPPPSLPTISPTPSVLKVTSVYPLGDYVAVFNTTSLTVSFNQPITLSQVRLEVVPTVKLALSLSPDHTILIAKPITSWDYKEYSVKIIGPQATNLIDYKVNFLDPSKVQSGGGDL